MPSSKLVAGDERGMRPSERLEEYQALTEATTKVKTPHLRAFAMELAGLEPATSWVRSRRSPN